MKDPETVDEIPWDIRERPEGPTAPHVQLAKPRACRHPKDRRTPAEGGGWTCVCGKVTDGAKVRRGRAVRKYGIQAEADAAKRLGLERRGRTTDPEDLGGSSDPAVVQAKTGPGFASAAWIRELEALEISARNRPRILLAMEKPGRGRKGRRFVVMLEDEFVRLTGLDARRKNLERVAGAALALLEDATGSAAYWQELTEALDALDETPAR